MADVPYATYAVGGAFDAFYRATMNTLVNNKINAANTANAATTLTPNILFQIPTRVGYILGYKYISANSGVTNIYLNSIVAGLAMTPLSSCLEACHVTNRNICLRAIHGYRFRCVREIMFAYGLNNPITASTMYTWVVAAYVSHIPHILSTMKLMNPTETYLSLFKNYIADDPLKRILLPKGVILRTIQIMGSYTIINIVAPCLQDIWYLL